METGLDFAIFQNHGYQGLYGGLDQKAIHENKHLKKSQKILDHMDQLNWQLICSALHRPKRNCGVIAFRENYKLTKFISR